MSAKVLHSPSMLNNVVSPLLQTNKHFADKITTVALNATTVCIAAIQKIGLVIKQKIKPLIYV